MWQGALHEKMKFSFKDFFSKSFQRIWSHLLKKSLMKNFHFVQRRWKYGEWRLVGLQWENSDNEVKYQDMR